MMDGDSEDLGSFVELLQQQNQQSLTWMKKLSDRVAELTRLYNDALERERDAVRAAQEQTEAVNQKLKALEDAIDRTAFVLVLVDADADAYLFGDRYYLDDPAAGGRYAAIDLRAAVKHHLRSVDESLVGLPVVAKVFASGDGLTHLLEKSAFARPGKSLEVVSLFARGFSQADDLFDFVLLGTPSSIGQAGKLRGYDEPRVDHKLMASFRQFVENPSCKHIFLAGCHDNGYVRLLEKYVNEPAVAAKVTLVW